MRINEHTYIYGKKIVLIPYESRHVPKYHEWMKSAELQALTASEPLTLEEEYEMQRSWRLDENSRHQRDEKNIETGHPDQECTFIVLDSKNYQEDDDVASMVGDVNLFFNEEDERSSAEVEIMIAETSSRGRGLGKEALICMMRYGMNDLNVMRYTAKIGMQNMPSLAMFKKLGFEEISRCDVFKEVTLELLVTSESKSRIELDTDEYKVTMKSAQSQGKCL